MQQNRTISNRPIAVYLRPFSSDGKVRVSPPNVLSRLLMPVMNWFADADSDLEDVLLQALEPQFQFIAIGDRASGVGAGKVTPYHVGWQEVFLRLLPVANCIISVPSIDQSTLWELKQISDQRMHAKVLMLLTDLHFRPDTHPRMNLDQIRPDLYTAGWKLPPVLQASSLVRFRTNGEPEIAVRRSGYKLRAFRKAANAISCQ